MVLIIKQYLYSKPILSSNCRTFPLPKLIQITLQPTRGLIINKPFLFEPSGFTPKPVKCGNNHGRASAVSRGYIEHSCPHHLLYGFSRTTVCREAERMELSCVTATAGPPTGPVQAYSGLYSGPLGLYKRQCWASEASVLCRRSTWIDSW